VRLVLITDSFPPLRTSASIQLWDLSREFVKQGHQLIVLLPDATVQTPWSHEQLDGVQILRLRAPKVKDVGYIRRTLGELLMPFVMMRQILKSGLDQSNWQGVVWYSPSIFHGPLVSCFKRASGCRAYLIIRDIFPEWAVDIGLMRRGLPYRFFDAVARYQYSVADVIGVQATGNLRYFKNWNQQSLGKLEVLNNWLSKSIKTPCSIRVSESALADRRVFVYAGNMGIAQGMDIFLELAERLLPRQDVGFLFVGRGSEVRRLRHLAQTRGLFNVLFYDEICPDEIPSLYSQCTAGLIALDPRHKSHNIPGKFLTYMRSGLPVLANVNTGNDLGQMIRDECVGQVCETNQVDELLHLAVKLLDQIKTDSALPARCTILFERQFTVEKAVKQITAALYEKESGRPLL
jgi:glycosyltransferase involved in cell wall biosynthesis